MNVLLQKKVSIIVPAYNVENYIQKCIDSLLRQTYSNIEIIIVDDGSTDRTKDIIDELYCDCDKIAIYHKENGGLADARNYGIDRMCGDYVTFVDSDDFVDAEYIYYLMDCIYRENADIAMIPVQYFFNYNAIDYEYDCEYEIVSAKEAVRRMLLRNSIAHTACGKIYKAYIWKNLQFPYGKLYEDYYTTFDAFSKSEKVIIGKAEMYFYYQRDTSIMHLQCDEKTVSIVNATMEVTPRIIHYWPELKDEAIDLQVALCLKCLQRIYECDLNGFKKTQMVIKQIVRKNARRIICSTKIGYKDKVKTMLSFFPRKIFLKIYNIFDGNINVEIENKIFKNI